MVISSIRERLPQKWRAKAKEITRKMPILTFLIAISYGFLLKPYLNPWIWKKGIPRMFVIPDICSIDCAVDIFIKGIYTKHYNIQEGDVVIDVGANVGMFSIKASMGIGKRGKVIAIEPIKENFKLLKKNVERIRYPNVIIMNEACGNKSGEATMIKSLLSGTHQLKSVGKIVESPIDEVKVKVTTLDNTCKEFDVSRIDLLKIDVEGAELEVLKGAEESLKFTKNIAMELHYKEEEVKRFLEERGFEVIVEEGMLYAKKIK